jgi:hypothetical protein
MNPWPIAPLEAKDLGFTAVNYDFTSLTASELGGTDQLLAGIDATATDFAQSLADQATLIASMEHDLDDLGTILREIDSDTFESIAGELAGAAAAGDIGIAAGTPDLPIGSFFNTGV